MAGKRALRGPGSSLAVALASLILAAVAVGVPGPAGAQGIGSWTTRDTLNTMRTEVGGAVVGGRLHVVGSFPGGTGGPGVHEAYDPTDDSWTTLAPLPADLNHAVAVELNGKLYVVGGWNSSLLPVATLYRYEAGTNTWTTLEPMPTPRAALAAFGYNNRIFAIGGNMASGGVGDTGVVEVYDPVTNTWAGDRKPMPTPRNHVMYGAIGGLLHVIGGRAVGFGLTMTNHDAYHPGTDTWVTLAPLPTGRSGGAAAVYKDRLHVIGGEAAATFEEHEAYDPKTNTWATLAPMLTARHGLAAGTIGERLYAASGGPSPGATYSNVLEAFTIALSCSPRPRVSVQTARVAAGHLTAQLGTATNPSTPPNRLVRLQFTRVDNARVDVRSLVDQRQPFTLELPDRPAGIGLVVRRLNPGPYTVSLVAHDDCGGWPTVVGGGVSA